MNKIFKVLWNKVRATSVVTDEAKTAHGKGRQGVLSTTLGAATVTGTASLLFVLSPIAMAASTITPGWNNTTVSSKDGVHNIKTNAIQGTVGINKFDQFEIVQKEIANLQFGSANKLLNFVNQQIKVDGTVNAVKDNKIGGDLYFISPQGMVVGSTGVINAGSLSVATPKQSTYDEWLTQADTPSMYADRLVDTIDSGHYAINPAGIITVNGSINAGNRIALRAKEITVGSTGALKTGVDDFANLVNIKNGTATVSAGLDPKLEFSVDSNSGDIILAARAEVESAGIISESKQGSTDQENVQATITVEKGGTVTAQGNIKATAEAGNGEYDLVKAAGSDKEGDYDFKVNEATQSYNVTATVTINGTLTAGGDIDLKAHAFNLVDNSFGFNLATITEQAGGGFANALSGSTVAYADADAVSKVVVGESGVVQAQNGSVNAEAITT
ncbi:MAG: leukotoxin LktA family filamentous adhesin, partial [Sutterellaceae bacterium]|nr:leukotoxin LktA family filamentous adhesin [Sutterellaceae bacterium]